MPNTEKTEQTDQQVVSLTDDSAQEPSTVFDRIFALLSASFSPVASEQTGGVIINMTVGQARLVLFVCKAKRAGSQTRSRWIITYLYNR